MPRAWSAEMMSTSVSWRARLSRKTKMMELARVAIAVSMLLKSKVDNSQMLLLSGTKGKRFLVARREKKKYPQNAQSTSPCGDTLHVVDKEKEKKRRNTRQGFARWKILTHRRSDVRSNDSYSSNCICLRASAILGMIR